MLYDIFPFLVIELYCWKGLLAAEFRRGVHAVDVTSSISKNCSRKKQNQEQTIAKWQAHAETKLVSL